MCPGGVASLIVGISGCQVGWAYGFPGIIVGIIGLVMSLKAKQTLADNPGLYRGERLVGSAVTWSVVGLIQGVVLTLLYILLFAFVISSGAERFYR